MLSRSAMEEVAAWAQQEPAGGGGGRPEALRALQCEISGREQLALGTTCMVKAAGAQKRHAAFNLWGMLTAVLRDVLVACGRQEVGACRGGQGKQGSFQGAEITGAMASSRALPRTGKHQPT